LGLTFVKGGQITETKSWLIKPRNNDFDYFNTLIHGLSEKDVAQKPEFDELWPEILPLLTNKFIIAHNAGFDISVLRWTLDSYLLSFPRFKYSCSYIFSKKIWEGLPAYDLKTLCQVNNIALNHHRAGPDSRATAELALRAFEIAGLTSINEFQEKLKTTIGEIYEGGYRRAETKRFRPYLNPLDIKGDPELHNPESIFYGRRVVFTGTLSSMIRSEAQQLIANIGGINSGGVTNDTDFLIVGLQDYRVVGEDGMSNKQERAIKLIQSGHHLEIISEADFLNHL
jgi:DNA polymerase-3 subunit epsilon